MAYFRNLDVRINEMIGLFNKGERLLILINADPDALASAMALKRILYRKVQTSAIAHVNEISRPDNLAMIKLLRIPIKKLTPPLAAQFDRFALVDSQPHHHPDFEKFEFSVILDHHPLKKENPPEALYKEINPDYGATSSLLTEYLYSLNIRPGKLLATALLYGIKTDTQSFERKFCDVDIRAFRYLTKFYNPLLLQKIVRSEFHKEWLKYFSLAFRKVKLLGHGASVFMGQGGISGYTGYSSRLFPAHSQYFLGYDQRNSSGFTGGGVQRRRIKKGYGKIVFSDVRQYRHSRRSQTDGPG
jgi:nanoRNase/pAp phosphatase (c-di-AMP/oligoRNAs hydrolase)